MRWGQLCPVRRWCSGLSPPFSSFFFALDVESQRKGGVVGGWVALMVAIGSQKIGVLARCESVRGAILGLV